MAKNPKQDRESATTELTQAVKAEVVSLESEQAYYARQKMIDEAEHDQMNLAERKTHQRIMDLFADSLEKGVAHRIAEGEPDRAAVLVSTEYAKVMDSARYVEHSKRALKGALVDPRTGLALNINNINAQKQEQSVENKRLRIIEKVETVPEEEYLKKNPPSNDAPEKTVIDVDEEVSEDDSD